MAGAASNVRDVADFFVWFCHDTGTFVSNLELQKFLYYAQGWHLALYDRPLFNEPLQAWVHGPVHPGTYGRFKQNGWNPISDPIEEPTLLPDVREHLVEVFSAYGKFSGWDLERMTHAEAPWREARGGLADDVSSRNVISHESMKRFFRGRLEEPEEDPNRGSASY